MLLIKTFREVSAKAERLLWNNSEFKFWIVKNWKKYSTFVEPKQILVSFVRNSKNIQILWNPNKL